MIRRTKALTNAAREQFEVEIRKRGWQPGTTIERIADVVALSPKQVRDAVFSESADTWRRSFLAGLREEER